MNRIELTHDEFAFLFSYISGFIDKSEKRICEIIEKALDCTEVSLLKVESFATTIEEAIDEFYESAWGSKKESAVTRNLISLTTNKDDLPAIYEDKIAYSFGDNSDETFLLIRRAVEILF